MNRKQMKDALKVDNTSKVYKFFKGLKNRAFYEALGDLKIYINHMLFCEKYKMIADRNICELWEISLHWMVQNEFIGQKFNNYGSFKEAYYQSGLEFDLFLDSNND